MWRWLKVLLASQVLGTLSAAQLKDKESHGSESQQAQDLLAETLSRLQATIGSTSEAQVGSLDTNIKHLFL